MSQKYILAGVGTAELIDKSSGNIVATSKTLVNSGVSFTVNANDVRGGLANKLLGQYFSDATMSITLEDALFDLNYLSLNTGGTVSVGGNIMTTEQITTTVVNQITATSTPKSFLTLGTIGWYALAGTDTWNKVTFVGSVATVSNLPIGSTICLKYLKEDAISEQFTVSSAFIPSQCYLLLTLPLFKTGLDTNTYASSSKVGEVQIEVPTYQLSGAQELNLTSSGTATSSISGMALASLGGASSCNSDGDYAYVKQIIFGQDEFANVKAIVVEDSDIDLAVAGTQKLVLYKLFNGVVAPALLANSKVTFTSLTTAKATVNSAGLVTGVASGSAVIECVVTGHTNLIATANVTVS